ncbi:uncharacterized protein LOC110980496 [Acanthaster planci]|uniref:Uncharacterized protein LOC110980496 n=1 Tax=Acanthaster planci TaxID=133434 RepID=A0A8B7YI60_ACAPL|nr:uncharacterized protein LOC110980496 [Acanthaster planci]XP_022092928.1 uncharacterized protein LOC110980496 [Acanthaster planci]XP_022092939.1 uncharacterized protein LOC110980496 [Acanthaster planci]XP_022092947.1 uncharacterized protein LOC110980496 [Acanthaster planci]
MEHSLATSGGLEVQETSTAIADAEAQPPAERNTDQAPALSSATEIVQGFPEGQQSRAPVQQTATRWSSRRNGGRASKAQEREELKKQRKMRIEKFDDFVEWIDGDVSLRYHPKDSDARKHLSGWAMRNTNNHNKKVLKKSCLGVYLCNRSCRSPHGEIVTIRPATSDRARRKQADKKCPRPGCEGRLYHVACAGKNGYPVTHFWRVTESVIIFQSKGRHDHPRPDVVKTPSVAKLALFEYHRAHKHERPKDICKRMGVHIHKSFSRVDRVARQLREVQTVLAKNDKGVDKKEEKETPSHGYSLRSPLTRMWASHHHHHHHHHQKLGPSDPQQQVRPGLTIPAGGMRHNSLGSSYQDQPQYESWAGNYFPQQHGLQSDYQHGYLAGYTPTQLPSDYYHHTGMYAGYQVASSAGSIVYDSAMELESYGTPLPPKADPLPEGGRMTELTVMKESPKQPMASLNGTPTLATVKSDSSMAHTGDGNLDLASLPLSHSSGSLLSPSGHGPLKRSLPPALTHIEAKQPKLEQSGSLESRNPIKLTEQTPGINIDMSSFSDIFDISASLGEEGLAGRPKTPVFHAPSPPVYESPQKPTGAAMSSDSTPLSPSSSQGEATARSQTPVSVSVASSPRTSHDYSNDAEPPLASPSGFKYRQLIHHSPSGPVLTELSTHPHQAPSNPAEDENGTYIDFLVSMYLKDSEKPISTLKNELHVYTERNNQKSLAFRAEQGLQFTPHLKSPTSSQFDFSWYDMDRRSQHFRAASSTQTSLISPLNIAGQFDFTSPFIKDQSPDTSRVLFMRNPPTNTVSLNRHVY